MFCFSKVNGKLKKLQKLMEKHMQSKLLVKVLKHFNYVFHLHLGCVLQHTSIYMGISPDPALSRAIGSSCRLGACVL